MKKKVSIIVILVAAVVAVIMIGVIPPVLDYQAKHRVYSDMVSEPAVFEYKKEHPGSGQEEYYDRLPRAQIVYKAEESDLAVISFQSEKQLSVVPVSDKIAPGSSGSAVYNEEMELIGINIEG